MGAAKSPPAPIGRYRIRHVGTGSLARQAAVAGAVLGVLPGAAMGALAALAVRVARQTLESWRTVRLPVPAPLPPNAVPAANFVDLLQLQGLLDLLRAWDAAPWLTLAAITLATALVFALVAAAVAAVAALLYNAGARLGGGVSVDLEAAPASR